MGLNLGRNGSVGLFMDIDGTCWVRLGLDVLSDACIGLGGSGWVQDGSGQACMGSDGL